MKASQIAQIVDAQVLCGEEFIDSLELSQAFGADLMSDVLAFVNGSTLILTGMVNLHVIRTADMLDVRCVLFVRDKQITDDIIEQARAQDMILLRSPKTLYECCGRLYEAGLPACRLGAQNE